MKYNHLDMLPEKAFRPVGKRMTLEGGGGGGIGGMIGSAVGSLGGVGKVIGPAIQLGSGANPLGVFGASLASEVIGNSLSGGGGGSGSNTGVTPGQNNMQNVYAQPGYNYGANTYNINKAPVDASKYFITGDKGVYNLLPQLAPLYGDQATNRLPGTSSYNVYQNIYNKMAGDTKAQQALASAFGPQTFTPTAGPYRGLNSITSPYIQSDLRRSINEQLRGVGVPKQPIMPNAFNSPMEYANAVRQAREQSRQDRLNKINAPIQYVDWGFGPGATSKSSPWESLANYAGTKNNPFFVPFAPTNNTGVTPANTTQQPPMTAPTGMESGGLAALAGDYQ